MFSNNINKDLPRGQTVPREEKGYSGELSTLGKLTYFTEYFEGITIEDKDIQSIIPIENPRESKSFKDGYKRGMTLVKQGFTRDNYRNFLTSLRTKPKKIIEETLQQKKKGHR